MFVFKKGWLVCEDQMCSYRSKRISCKFNGGKPLCIECEKSFAHLEYSHSDLYYQMKFFKFMFDIDAYKNYYKDDGGMFLIIAPFFFSFIIELFLLIFKWK